MEAYTVIILRKQVYSVTNIGIDLTISNVAEDQEEAKQEFRKSRYSLHEFKKTAFLRTMTA